MQKQSNFFESNLNSLADLIHIKINARNVETLQSDKLQSMDMKIHNGLEDTNYAVAKNKMIGTNNLIFAWGECNILF